MIDVDQWTSGPDAADAWLDEWSAEADGRVAQARAFADGVAAQTVGAHSPIGRDVVAGYGARFPAPRAHERREPA